MATGIFQAYFSFKLCQIVCAKRYIPFLERVHSIEVDKHQIILYSSTIYRDHEG